MRESVMSNQHQAKYHLVILILGLLFGGTGCADESFIRSDESAADTGQELVRPEQPELPSDPPSLSMPKSPADEGHSGYVHHDPHIASVLIDQLNQDGTRMMMSQNRERHAATLVNLGHTTLITSLAWSGSMLPSEAFIYNEAGPTIMTTRSAESHEFLIQIFTGDTRPDMEPIEEHRVEAEIIDQDQSQITYRWIGGLLEPLRAGRYWIAIVGLEDDHFYWTVERSHAQSESGSGGSIRRVDGAWEPVDQGSSRVNGCGFSIQVEAIEYIDPPE